MKSIASRYCRRHPDQAALRCIRRSATTITATIAATASILPPFSHMNPIYPHGVAEEVVSCLSLVRSRTSLGIQRHQSSVIEEGEGACVSWERVSQKLFYMKISETHQSSTFALHYSRLFATSNRMVNTTPSAMITFIQN